MSRVSVTQVMDPYIRTNDLAIQKCSNGALCPVKLHARILHFCCTLMKLHVSCLSVARVVDPSTFATSSLTSSEDNVVYFP